MRRIVLILLVLTLKACAPATIITGSWKSPTNTSASKSYENILVAVLNNHTVEKAALENDLVGELGRYSIKVTKSIDLFPPEVSNSDSDRVAIINKVHSKDIDAILMVSLLSKQTDSRYVQRRYPYNPGRYTYYNDFWGYYSYRYPYAYSPGYYTEKSYYMETNLYDAKTEKLIWSAQTETYDVDNLTAFSKDYSKAIVNKLAEDGILKPVPQNP